MTNVYLEKDESGCTVNCAGHATGNAAVCAGVSAIMYGLSGWLINNPAVKVHEEKLEDGFALIRFGRTKESEVVFDFVVIALMQIAESYPMFCTVQEYRAKE